VASRSAAADLLATHANLYFDYLEQTSARDQNDAQDIYWYLVNKHKPVYNVAPVKPSGRSGSIDVVEE